MKESYYLRVMDWKKISQAKGPKKQADVAILIPNKIASNQNNQEMENDTIYLPMEKYTNIIFQFFFFCNFTFSCISFNFAFLLTFLIFKIHLFLHSRFYFLPSPTLTVPHSIPPHLPSIHKDVPTLPHL